MFSSSNCRWAYPRSPHIYWIWGKVRGASR